MFNPLSASDVPANFPMRLFFSLRNCLPLCNQKAALVIKSYCPTDTALYEKRHGIEPCQVFHRRNSILATYFIAADLAVSDMDDTMGVVSYIVLVSDHHNGITLLVKLLK